ncbi:MAG: ankyrin repeat domain-containing protein [Planctomycetia bacterium]|nr:ankyrin repeat domain-containing protein [Planctomycetia bacterium]
MDNSSAVRANFWRFSLRQLCVLMVALAVLCALVSRPLNERAKKRREQRAFDQLIAASKNLDKAARNLDEAARTNDVQLAEQTFELGYRAEQLFARRNASLHHCVSGGHLELLELLLEHGAPNPGLVSVLQSKQPSDVQKKMAQLLIKFGADPAEPAAMDLAVQKYDLKAAELLEESGAVLGPRELAAFNRLDELKRLVHDQPELLHQRLKRIYAGEAPTLLGLALAGGYREMSLFLIDAGAPLDIREALGLTMLHLAARGGDPELVRFLVARGLSVHDRDEYKDTPLSDIGGTGKPEVIRTLIELGSDVNSQGMNQYTPLYRAVLANREDLVCIYLDAGSDPMIPALTHRDSGGLNDWHEQTTLELARKSHPQFVKVLEETIAKR